MAKQVTPGHADGQVIPLFMQDWQRGKYSSQDTLRYVLTGIDEMVQQHALTSAREIKLLRKLAAVIISGKSHSALETLIDPMIAIVTALKAKKSSCKVHHRFKYG